MERLGIFVGVACHKPWKQHTESLAQFLLDCSLKYDIECLQVYGKQLVDAQNQIAERFLASGKQYLLMIEDDHWGFTLEMLDALVKDNYYVCGMKYFSRHYPYVAMPMEWRSDEDPEDEFYRLFQMNVIGHPEGGYHPVGLCCFGMTAIRREVFEELDKPYFQINKKGKRPSTYATDSNFFTRLRSLGIIPMGCFDHCITHRWLNNETVESRRELAAGNSPFLSRYIMAHKNRELAKVTL